MVVWVAIGVEFGGGGNRGDGGEGGSRGGGGEVVLG